MSSNNSSAVVSKKEKRRRMRKSSTSLLGPYLLKLAKSCISQENFHKALEYAKQAVKFFEQQHGLELVMSLYILAEAHCRLGEYGEAVGVLQRSLCVEIGHKDVPNMLARASGYMQLGDTLALMGRHQQSLDAYHSALDVQKGALGDRDPCVAETCRYLAQAHLQVMQFDEAEELCNHLLEIPHSSEHGRSELEEESSDRRLMALICSGRGDHQGALEHLLEASNKTLHLNLDSASIQACIGDTLAALGRDSEAESAYQNALAVFRSIKGESHAAVASVYLSLSDVQVKAGNLSQAKAYCESAARIYEQSDVGHGEDELASGFVETAAMYEALGEPDRAVGLLQRALEIIPRQHGGTAAGVLVQLGMVLCSLGRLEEGIWALSGALETLGEKRDRFDEAKRHLLSE